MSKKKKPTITVQHKIRRAREPKHITIEVTLEASANDRRQAYVAYEEELRKFDSLIEGLGEMVVSSAPKIPSEGILDDKGKSHPKVSLIGVATVQILPSASLGALLCGLVESGFKFKNPSVEYEVSEDVPSDVYEELASGARAKAEATARGAGATLGSIVEITFPQTNSVQWNTNLNWLWSRPRSPWYWPDYSSRLSLFGNRTPEPAPGPLDPAVYDLLNAEVKSYSDEISILVVYQLEVT